MPNHAMMRLWSFDQVEKVEQTPNVGILLTEQTSTIDGFRPEEKQQRLWSGDGGGAWY